MTGQILTVDIPPTEWLTANMHLGTWRRAARTQALRSRAGWMARQARLRPVQGRVRIVALIHRDREMHWDPNNSADTTKALVDGLRDAGVLTDDDRKHVVGPDHRDGGVLPGLAPGWVRVVLTIEPAAAAREED